MNVFSMCPSPLFVPHKEKGGQKIIKIMPGRNRIEDKIWKGIKGLQAITVRMDRGHIRASQDLSADLNKGESRRLVSQAGTEFIEDLCAKSAPVSDGKIDGSEDDYELVR